MKRWGLILLVLLVTLGVHAASQSTAQTIMDTPLNNAPYSDAGAIVTLPASTNITIIERQGGWYHVRLDSGQDGWLRMTSIRMNGSDTGSSWGFGWVSQLFESGRSGATGTTATTGVRGLNSGDIANAKPDKQAVSEITTWTATPEQARQFAQQLSLKPKQVNYLPLVRGGQP